MAALAAELAERPHNLLQKLTDTIVDYGMADSAGVSILNESQGRLFCWEVLSGGWRHFRGGTMPFDASPCGVVVQRNEMLLFERPDRYCPAPEGEPLIHELLLLPFHSQGRPVGTLWIATHDPTREFDGEDARLLTRLTSLASAGFQTVRALAEVQAGRDELERRVTARTGELRESEERFRAFVNASSDVVYRMSPDWSQMRQLDGRGFLADTIEPSGTWMEAYIHPDGRPVVIAAIEEAIRSKTMFELEHRGSLLNYSSGQRGRASCRCRNRQYRQRARGGPC